MTIAWIAEVANFTDTEYQTWCDVPSGPLAYLGVLGGKDCGNDKVPIHPKTFYHVERCAVPWNFGKHFRYLAGPQGVVRMHCTTASGADRIVFENNATGERIGNLSIGSPHSGEYERVSFSIIIEDEAINWLVKYGDCAHGDFLETISKSATRLAPMLSAILGHYHRRLEPAAFRCS